MTTRTPLPILAITASLHLAGCGCSETGLSGDSSVDGDTPIADPWWDPPIETLGEPGWEESTSPWCDDPVGEFYGFDVWSDSRGVFVLGTQYYYPPGGEETTVVRIHFNDGTGWRDYLDEEYGLAECESGVGSCGLRRITGVDGGVLFGWGSNSVATIEEGRITRQEERLEDLTAVHENLAYAAPSSDPRLYWWDGTDWGPFPGEALPYEVGRIWASETCIFGAGYDGIVLSWTEDSWTVHDTRTTENITAIWGFNCEDVWVGTESGAVHHYTAESGWAELAPPVLGAFGATEIEGMWGDDGVLFFYSRHQLTSWDGSGFEVLAHWPPSTGSSGIEIRAIWGNSPEEVFMAVVDPDHASSACGEQLLLWWDGSEFHWF